MLNNTLVVIGKPFSQPQLCIVVSTYKVQGQDKAVTKSKNVSQLAFGHDRIIP